MKNTAKRQRKIQTRRSSVAHERRSLVGIAGARSPMIADGSAADLIRMYTEAARPEWRPRIPRSLRALYKRVCRERAESILKSWGKPCSVDEFYRRHPQMAR